MLFQMMNDGVCIQTEQVRQWTDGMSIVLRNLPDQLVEYNTTQ